MTIEEAKSRLLNTAWLGTDEDRDKTEEAVGVLFDAVKAIEDIKQEIIDNSIFETTENGLKKYHMSALTMFYQLLIST